MVELPLLKKIPYANEGHSFILIFNWTQLVLNYHIYPIFVICIDFKMKNALMYEQPSIEKCVLQRVWFHDYFR